MSAKHINPALSGAVFQVMVIMFGFVTLWSVPPTIS